MYSGRSLGFRCLTFLIPIPFCFSLLPPAKFSDMTQVLTLILMNEHRPPFSFTPISLRVHLYSLSLLSSSLLPHNFRAPLLLPPTLYEGISAFLH